MYPVDMEDFTSTRSVPYEGGRRQQEIERLGWGWSLGVSNVNAGGFDFSIQQLLIWRSVTGCDEH